MTVDQPRLLIVEARFYTDIADQLAEGAIAAIEKAGCAHQRIAVPGVFEVPAAIRFAIRSMEVRATSQRYAGFVALGCVIRGETDHYDHICRESSRALMDLAVNHSVALGFGILTCDTDEQAYARCAPKGEHNVGGRAAEACLRMMALKQDMHLVPR